MTEIDDEFILNQYRSGIENYSRLTKEIGLWESEKHVFLKYLNKSDRILDLGCGTGRTTFHLYRLGYDNIQGLDLTHEMIIEAKRLNGHFQTKIEFQVGDATNLNFDNSSFESLIFSFNGIMSIPSTEKRTKALKEIHRVLSPNGIFIFTTHDRNANKEYTLFWENEKQIWLDGKQNPTLFEYGDIIVNTNNEAREVFIHIPTESEIKDWLTSNKFEIIETFFRLDKFNESMSVKDSSGECRFWIARRH